MLTIDSQREQFVHWAGLAVIGLAVLLFALCIIVSITTVLGGGQHDSRPLLTVSATQESLHSSYTLPSGVA